MILTNKEIDIFKDKDFLITKTIVINKVHHLFEEVRSTLKESVSNSSFTFPLEVDTKIGKIFRGENYNMLPYVNLDYPKLFVGNDIFTFRTMFLWGSFFSSTLHLSGKYLDGYKKNILSNLQDYLNEDLYICVNESPWHYHYGTDNYVKLTKNNIQLIENLNFLKLNMKFELNDYNQLPLLANNCLEKCLRIIS